MSSPAPVEEIEDITEAANEEQSTYHTKYDLSDADLVLEASDGVRFKVHSFIMGLASEFFKGMQSLPQPAVENPSIRTGSTNSTVLNNILVLSEPSNVLEWMLDIVYPGRHPSIDSIHDFNLLSNLADAGEKYDMPDILQIIRSGVIRQSFAQQHPLEVYVLACRHGWDSLAKEVSRYTLGINLLSRESVAHVRKLDVMAFIRLLELQQRRRDLLSRALVLNSNPGSRARMMVNLVSLNSNHADSCNRLSRFKVDKSVWDAMELHVMYEMNKDASGDGICSDDFWTRGAFDNLYLQICGHCGQPCITPTGMEMEMKRLIKELPDTITM